jgi:putative methyltransferase (TIGR04325 family)
VNLRVLAKRLLPPAVVDAGRRVGLFGAREWEYVPEGWATHDTRVKGWDDESVVAAQVEKWPEFVRAVENSGPLGITLDSVSPSSLDPGAHNQVMTYAYVLARAAHLRSRVSVLDWGAGLGQYFVFSRALLPEVEFNYTCKDLPLACVAGGRLLPDVTFCEDASCLERHFDLVHAGTSLQYSEDWRSVATGLAGAAGEYLYVSRVPVIATVSLRLQDRVFVLVPQSRRVHRPH